MKNAPILIIGKNGKTGARVNQRLEALGLQTRAVSRSGTPSFDWNNSVTWPAVMQGCKQAYVTYQPDLAVPAAEAAIKAFVNVAKDNGIEHIVLLSGRGEDGAQRAERVLQTSGISWNIVRCSWFSQNFSESFMIEGIIAGELVLPAADTIEPFVDADDIADVAVACLTDTHHRNKLFELTGPQAINFAQCVAEISAQLNRPIKYTPVPIDVYIDALQQQGAPEDLQWLLRELFTVVFDGRNSQPMHGIEQALGRAPSDFKTYVQKTIASGAWDAALQKQSA